MTEITYLCDVQEGTLSGTVTETQDPSAHIIQYKTPSVCTVGAEGTLRKTKTRKATLI